MGTVDLLALITDARALGLSLNTNGDKLNVTGPKTPEAAALVQAIAPHKAAVIELLRTPLQPAPIADPTEPAPLDAGQLAYYKHYVGKVVADEVITRLIHDANRHGFRITFDAQGDWRNACDYLVTSARFV